MAHELETINFYRNVYEGEKVITMWLKENDFKMNLPLKAPVSFALEIATYNLKCQGVECDNQLEQAVSEILVSHWEALGGEVDIV